MKLVGMEMMRGMSGISCRMHLKEVWKAWN